GDVRLPGVHRPRHPLRLAEAGSHLDVTRSARARPGTMREENGPYGGEGPPDDRAGGQAGTQADEVRPELGQAVLALGVQLRAGLLRDRVHRDLDEPP